MPRGITGEEEKKDEAPVAVKALTTDIGGDAIATTAAIAIPAQIDTEITAPWVGTLTTTERPNSAQSTPTIPRYPHIERATV